MDHHYLPQFYLRQWATEGEGRVLRYRREPTGKVSEMRVTPRGTAFEPDLYTVRDAGPVFRQPDPHVVETDFLGPIDDAAAKVLMKLLTGPVSALDRGDRSAWALFLNSLRERHAATIRARDDRAPEVAGVVYRDTLARYTSERDRGLVQTFLEDLDQDQLARNMVREDMVRRTKRPEMIAFLVSRRWTVATTAAELPLFTSDSPLVINFGAPPDPVESLALSISPHRLLILHPPDWRLDSETLACLAVEYNLRVMHGRPKFVYSSIPIRNCCGIRFRDALEDFLGRAQATDSSQ